MRRSSTDAQDPDAVADQNSESAFVDQCTEEGEGASRSSATNNQGTLLGDHQAEEIGYYDQQVDEAYQQGLAQTTDQATTEVMHLQFYGDSLLGS